MAQAGAQGTTNDLPAAAPSTAAAPKFGAAAVLGAAGPKFAGLSTALQRQQSEFDEVNQKLTELNLER